MSYIVTSDTQAIIPGNVRVKFDDWVYTKGLAFKIKEKGSGNRSVQVLLGPAVWISGPKIGQNEGGDINSWVDAKWFIKTQFHLNIIPGAYMLWSSCTSPTPWNKFVLPSVQLLCLSFSERSLLSPNSRIWQRKLHCFVYNAFSNFKIFVDSYISHNLEAFNHKRLIPTGKMVGLFST